MQLTNAQKTTLKTHMAANTNTTPATAADGSALTTPFVINTRLATFNPEDERAIAEWYNVNAKAGDNQAFANRLVWNNNLTVQQLNGAVDWTTDPVHGLGGSPTVDQQQLAINNQWWKYDQMTKKGSVDMSDPQVRNGLLRIFGDTANGSANKIANGGGQVTGLRFELALASNAGANNPVGAATNAWGAAYKPITLKDGTVLTNGNALLTQPDVDDILRNG